MNNYDDPEYSKAMTVLEEFCAHENIKVNDKLREVFWHGVVHGKQRGLCQAALHDEFSMIPRMSESTVKDSKPDFMLRRSDPELGDDVTDLSRPAAFKL